MKYNGFIIALFAAILLAYFVPTALKNFPLEIIIDLGIALIFFFYGLKLAPTDLKLGFLNYPSHILIQLTTFVLFPLLTFLFIPVFEGGIQSDLWLAVFFLGVLPSTVSSSVVMVAIAKGNLPTAIFNASISGLIGILVTPLWLSLFLMKTGEFAILSIITKLLLQIVFPLLIGLLLQRFLGNLARKNSRILSLFDKSVIILIVYSSFSNSFNSNLFESIKTMDLLKISVIVVILFFVVYGSTGYICKLLGFNLRDTITVRFAGTKKSLVHGSVMAKIIFGSTASLGLLLLPIMLYHILQLLLVAVFAERYRKQWIKNGELE
ncbi:bile acid:sodium symporter [Gillisia limnaea]|uniref:Bile acid:sodium symporter n=1 Tax=Gillisia limnaea (strain DSM 15749 / LMG 21470 / R-8282) TaxID=865937 RepID=H2BWU5_GILLR|nr:bile acid:sodium symporter [Gillisia limnaea]EHQ04118.1 Bile acid:sodium symporter [Gillisia limnaea DSM 15749]